MYHQAAENPPCRLRIADTSDSVWLDLTAMLRSPGTNGQGNIARIREPTVLYVKRLPALKGLLLRWNALCRSPNQKMACGRDGPGRLRLRRIRDDLRARSKTTRARRGDGGCGQSLHGHSAAPDALVRAPSVRSASCARQGSAGFPAKQPATRVMLVFQRAPRDHRRLPPGRLGTFAGLRGLRGYTCRDRLRGRRGRA